MLSRYKTVFIIIIILVNICLAVGLYMSSQQKQLALDDLHKVITTTDETSGKPGEEQQYSRIDEPRKGLWQNLSLLRNRIASMISGNPVMTDDDKITATIEKKLDKKVEQKDAAKVAAIILKKLDSDEISYLYRTATKDDPSTEELKKAKKILLDKLDREEIDTIKRITLKYGKDYLKTLDI